MGIYKYRVHYYNEYDNNMKVASGIVTGETMGQAVDYIDKELYPMVDWIQIIGLESSNDGYIETDERNGTEEDLIG